MIRAIKRLLNLLLSNTVNPRKLQARREYTDSGAKKESNVMVMIFIFKIFLKNIVNIKIRIKRFPILKIG